MFPPAAAVIFGTLGGLWFSESGYGRQVVGWRVFNVARESVGSGIAESVPDWVLPAFLGFTVLVVVVFFAGLSALLALINIFLYKKRKLQMKVGTLTSLLILFFYVTLYVYFNAYTVKYGLTFSSFQFGLILPVIALIFNVLAILRIKKDENLVKSLDRIR